MTKADSLIVLRFRDIGLIAGSTITEHRRTIGQHGHCWWGWLYREYEVNPHRVVTELAESRHTPFPVILFDTGRTLLYEAACDRINAYPHARRSPQVSHTPGYYNDRPAPAWFRFSDIVEASPSVVVGKTCVDLPSASDECFTDLLGQQVSHVRDLRRQEVTMWVVQ
jgi:hypothetical protein